MTHEQHVKRFIKNMYLRVYGVVGPAQEKEINDFFTHLVKAVKADITKETRCRNANKS